MTKRRSGVALDGSWTDAHGINHACRSHRSERGHWAYDVFCSPPYTRTLRAEDVDRPGFAITCIACVARLACRS